MERRRAPGGPNSRHRARGRRSPAPETPPRRSRGRRAASPRCTRADPRRASLPGRAETAQARTPRKARNVRRLSQADPKAPPPRSGARKGSTRPRPNALPEPDRYTRASAATTSHVHPRRSNPSTIDGGTTGWRSSRVIRAAPRGRRRAHWSASRPSPAPSSSTSAGRLPASAPATSRALPIRALIRARSRREPIARGSSGGRASRSSGVRVRVMPSRRSGSRRPTPDRRPSRTPSRPARRVPGGV